MNLVKDPWLPFKLKDGSEKVLPLSEISNPDVVDFALPRADFQGAAYQFAIGLLQTVLAPEDEFEWNDLYDEVPEKETLQEAFDKVSHAFNVSGDAPLFMQDFDSLKSANESPVSALLIEVPGANALKLNTDHFIKRGLAQCMSLEMAVLALFTLQINAPSGGQGHRTGLRGGGPLTTLILPQYTSSTLWQKLWLNVIHREQWDYEEPDYYSEALFPWLAHTKCSDKKGTEIYTNDVHPLHMFWAMPRRIRLQVDDDEQVCAVSGLMRSPVVQYYLTQNYGGNYGGTWDHPLTPYRFNPKKPEEEHLSVKGQQGGITYKIWDTLLLQSDVDGQSPARVVRSFSTICPEFLGRKSELPRLWVFGYDMDNMKARGWYSVEMPIFSIPPDQEERVLAEVKILQSLADEAIKACRKQIKEAWFDRPKEAKGDLTFVDVAFWQRTENSFFEAIRLLVISETQRLSTDEAKRWLDEVTSITATLFDEIVLSNLHADRSMAKKVRARRLLEVWLLFGKSVKAFKKKNNIEIPRVRKIL